MAIQPVGGGPSSSDYTRNAQHVGAQTEAVSDDEEGTEESEESEEQSSEARKTNEEDQLELFGQEQRSTKTGAHTGVAQTLGKKTTRGTADDKQGPPVQLELPFPQQEQKKPAGPQVPLFMSSMPQNMPAGGVGPRVQAALPGAVGAPTGNQQQPGPVGPGTGSGQATTPGPVGPPSTAVGGDAAAANMAQMAQTDALQANQTYWAMAAERQKAMWKIYQMMQDLQTSIMSIIADAAAKRAKTMDAIAQKWAQVLGG
jgi:hypothetical protein